MKFNDITPKTYIDVMNSIEVDIFYKYSGKVTVGNYLDIIYNLIPTRSLPPKQKMKVRGKTYERYSTTIYTWFEAANGKLKLDRVMTDKEICKITSAFIFYMYEKKNSKGTETEQNA